MIKLIDLISSAAQFIVGGLTNAISFMNLSWQSLVQLSAFLPSFVFTAFLTICIVAVCRLVVSWL